MSRHAFGGHSRIDKCNLMGPSLIDDVLVDVVSTEPERVLWVSVVASALNDYLFYGLGTNGTSRDEFWFSCEFLFRTRSTEPQTWLGAKHTSAIYFDADGIRRKHHQTIDDDTLRGMCLDAIWSMGKWPMPLDRFLTRLRDERRDILSRNWSQVRRYLGLTTDRETAIRVLTAPASPEELLSVLRNESVEMAVAA